MIDKVGNAVDLGSGAILSVEVQPADKPGAQGMAATLKAPPTEEVAKSGCKAEVESKEVEVEAGAGVELECGEARCIRAVCDKGYHKLEELEELAGPG